MRRPSSYASRFRPARLARVWCAALLALALLPAAGTAQAQTTTTLVSNIDQTVWATGFQTHIWRRAISFTTGNSRHGYMLTSVDVGFREAPDSTVIVKLSKGPSAPATVVATLTNPSTLSTGVLTFTAPSGTTLDAGTKYWVTVEGGGSDAAISTTRSAAEDSGSQSGWAVGDNIISQNIASPGSWQGGIVRAMRIRVKGYEIPDTFGPVLSSAAVGASDRKKIKLVFDEPLAPRSIPDPRAFTAKVNGSNVSVSPTDRIVVKGNTVTVTLANAVPTAATTTVTVSYNKVQAKTFGDRFPLKDALGNETDTFSDQTVRSTNSKPTYNATTTYRLTNSINAPAITAVSLDYDPDRFTDPDGDAVTVSKTVSRPDATTTTTFNSLVDRQFWFHKPHCALANLDPPIRAPHTSTITYRATDPYGATSDPVTMNFVLGGARRTCPEMTGAAVDGKTLTLTYTSTAMGRVPSGLAPSEFTVTADGEDVDVSSVSIGSPTDTTEARTVLVTLTLAEAVWAGQTAKVSHRPSGFQRTLLDGSVVTDYRVGRFTDQDVTVNTSNNRPTITVPDEAHLEQNAPPGQLKTAKVTIADPDITSSSLTLVEAEGTPTDANTVNVWVTADPPGVVDDDDKGYSTFLKSAYFEIKSNDELCALDSPPEDSFETTFTVTATDSDGATSAPVEIVATTAWDPDECEPAFEGAVVDGVALTLTFSKALDEASAPAATAFAVTAAGETRTVSDVAVSGSKVVLTLSSAVGEGETVTVGYARPPSNPLRGADTPQLPVENFSGESVTNATGETPELADAVVFGTKLMLYYDEDLDTTSVPAAGDFTVTVDGSPRMLAPVVPVAVVDNRVELTLAAPEVTRDQAVTVGYAAGTNPIRDTATPTPYEAADFSGEAVRNLGADATAPRLRAATVEGNLLTLTYNELLDPDSVPQPAAFRVYVGETKTRNDVTEVAVRGSRVELTLTTAVNAGDPATNVPPEPVALQVNFSSVPTERLQDIAGNHAANIGSEADHPVTHGPPPTAAPGTPSGGGGGGGGGTVGPGSAPVFGGATVAVPALRAGEAMTPVTLPEASGGDGALSYALSSTPGGLAGLSFDAAARRLSGTPTASGDYAFVYRAHDADADRADSDAAVLRFSVRVEENPVAAAVRRVVRKALAAVGARTLAGVLGNVGARFADAAPDTNFRLAGREVLFGGAAPAVMERACRAAYERPVYERAVFERAGCAPAQAVSGEDLMRASAFAWTPASAGGSASADAPLWALWGRGDFGAFEGRPEPGAHYDGETRTGWLGFDARRGPWVAGIALSRGTSESDYGFEAGGVAGRGRLETTLTAAYPYGRWRFANGLELRAVVGAGSGEARHMPGEGSRETGDLTMRMASVGVTRDLFRAAGFDFTVRADASAVRLEVERVAEGPPGAISGVTADTHRFRLGLEASRRVELAGGASLTPFVEAAARRDGGDGVEGSGVEIAGGVRYASALFHLEARGRWLAAHSGDGVRERGASVTARFGPGAQGRGLWFAVTPRWGAPAGNAEALWRDDMPKLRPEAREAVLDARVGYGFAWDSRGLVTPFAETSTGESSRRLRLGTRFEASRADLAMELAGERRESEGAEPVHGMRLDVRLGF